MLRRQMLEETTYKKWDSPTIILGLQSMLKELLRVQVAILLSSSTVGGHVPTKHEQNLPKKKKNKKNSEHMPTTVQFSRV